MIRGSCLCRGVQFEIESAVGPFELCHCSRCRKASGSQFMAGLAIRAQGFRVIAGRELITTFELPVRDEPPAYSRIFCRRCGCIVPDPEPTTEVFEIAAGLLDDDPGLRPDKHIMVEHKAPWTDFRTDELPQLDRAALLKQRSSAADGCSTENHASAAAGPEAIYKAVLTYIAAWNERDPGRRKLLLSSAVSEDIHIAIAGRELTGLAALEAEIASFHKAFPAARGRLTTSIDIQERVCRFGAVVEQPDGSKLAEMLDACTCDSSGRITRIITFSGVSVESRA